MIAKNEIITKHILEIVSAEYCENFACDVGFVFFHRVFVFESKTKCFGVSALADVLVDFFIC